MTQTRKVFSFLLTLILIPVSFSGNAQIVDVSACRAIEDRLSRFDCYESLDAEAARVNERTAVQQQPVAEVPTVAPRVTREPVVTQQLPAAPAPQSVAPQDVAPQSVDSFGKKAETASVRVIEGTDGKTELVDTIAALEERRQNLWLITTASGQQWLQMESKRYQMKKGDEIRIYPSRWGTAYRLTVPRLSGFIQVQRVD